MTELPPLPPANTLWDRPYLHYYTADQMREYAKQAVEADRIARVVCCPECGCHFSGSLDDYYRVVPPLD